MLPINAQALGKKAALEFDSDLLDTIKVSNGKAFVKALQVQID